MTWLHFESRTFTFLCVKQHKCGSANDFARTLPGVTWQKGEQVVLWCLVFTTCGPECQQESESGWEGRFPVATSEVAQMLVRGDTSQGPWKSSSGSVLTTSSQGHSLSYS